MDANVILSAISSVGFPIVVSVALFWYMVTEGRANREAINNNTAAMTKLVEHITGENGDDK